MTFLDTAPPELADKWPEKVDAYREQGVEANTQKLVQRMLDTLSQGEGIRLVADMLLYRDAYLDGKPLHIPLSGNGVIITLALEDDE